MPRTVEMREEELERLEEEGGLKKETIKDRESYYSHFETFFLEETKGETVQQALASHEGRAQFEKLLGRSSLNYIYCWSPLKFFNKRFQSGQHRIVPANCEQFKGTPVLKIALYLFRFSFFFFNQE